MLKSKKLKDGTRVSILYEKVPGVTVLIYPKLLANVYPKYRNSDGTWYLHIRSTQIGQEDLEEFQQEVLNMKKVIKEAQKFLTETLRQINLKNKLPSVSMYTKYLEAAVQKLGISKDEARNRFGLYTISQWEELLKNK
jgi:hypothetical protein